MIWGGSPAKIIKAAEDKKICVMVSEEIVGEISRTLAYPRLRQVYANSGVTRQELIETVLRIGKLLEVTKRLNVIREDPADNKFIECAVASEVDYLVSGDKHLLKIDCYQKTRILPVSEFLKVFGNKKNTRLNGDAKRAYQKRLLPFPWEVQPINKGGGRCFRAASVPVWLQFV